MGTIVASLAVIFTLNHIGYIQICTMNLHVNQLLDITVYKQKQLSGPVEKERSRRRRRKSSSKALTRFSSL